MAIHQKPFNARNWYWIVAGSASQVYSSASGDYVPVSDNAYQAWLASGRVPTTIDSEASLGAVLAQFSLRPVAAGLLDSYADAQATSLPADVVAKVLFNHENRIRTLASQPQVSAAQFKNFLKGLV